MVRNSKLINTATSLAEKMMAFSSKMGKKFSSSQKVTNVANQLMLANSHAQKKKNDSSEGSLFARVQFSSDGMNTETKNNLSTLTTKTEVGITISSVNHEEVNPSSSAISHDKTSGMVKVSASSILTATS
jgi:hypothetical protein